jgi:hypothetical protein
VGEFKFMAITNKTNTTGLDYQDGILGLSPDETENGPSFVAALKN